MDSDPVLGSDLHRVYEWVITSDGAVYSPDDYIPLPKRESAVRVKTNLGIDDLNSPKYFKTIEDRYAWAKRIGSGA